MLPLVAVAAVPAADPRAAPHLMLGVGTSERKEYLRMFSKELEDLKAGVG